MTLSYTYQIKESRQWGTLKNLLGNIYGEVEDDRGEEVVVTLPPVCRLHVDREFGVVDENITALTSEVSEPDRTAS